MAFCLTRFARDLTTFRPGSSPMRLSAIALAASAVCALAALPAHAQTAPAPVAAAPTDVEQIVVTARKRLERLQDVPLAITAITSKTLEDASVTNILDVAKLTPA